MASTAKLSREGGNQESRGDRDACAGGRMAPSSTWHSGVEKKKNPQTKGAPEALAKLHHQDCKADIHKMDCQTV